MTLSGVKGGGVPPPSTIFVPAALWRARKPGSLKEEGDEDWWKKVLTIKHTERELFQTDHLGEIVPNDKQTAFRAEVALTCQAADKSIDLGLIVVGEVPLARIAAIEKDNRLQAVAYAIGKQVAEDLTKARSWELYRTEQIYVPASATIEPKNHEQFVAEVALNDDLAAAFQDATEHQGEVSAAFEGAKEFLTSHMYSIFVVAAKQAQPQDSSLNACEMTDRRICTLGTEKRHTA